jgi:hypothetical protein
LLIVCILKSIFVKLVKKKKIMKKINLLLMSIALCVGLNLNAQVDVTTNTQQVSARVVSSAEAKMDEKKGLSFTKMEIVRENINYGTDDLFVFEFKNESQQEALITGVQTSCGCTTANKPEEPLSPGKSSSISVKYDTKRVGQFNKTITVSSNVSDPIILTIRGSVLPDKTEGEQAQPVLQH